MGLILALVVLLSFAIIPIYAASYFAKAYRFDPNGSGVALFLSIGFSTAYIGLFVPWFLSSFRSDLINASNISVALIFIIFGLGGMGILLIREWKRS